MGGPPQSSGRGSGDQRRHHNRGGVSPLSDVGRGVLCLAARVRPPPPTEPVPTRIANGGYGAFSPIRRVVSHRLQGAESRPIRRGQREGELRTLRAIRLRQRDQQGSTHIPTERSALSTDAFPRKVDRFFQHFAILLSKGKLGEPSMATPQVKTVRKSAPAARSNPAAKTAGKPTATPAVQKLAATKASNQKGPRRLLLSPLR